MQTSIAFLRSFQIAIRHHHGIEPRYERPEIREQRRIFTNGTSAATQTGELERLVLADVFERKAPERYPSSVVHLSSLHALHEGLIVFALMPANHGLGLHHRRNDRNVLRCKRGHHRLGRAAQLCQVLVALYFSRHPWRHEPCLPPLQVLTPPPNRRRPIRIRFSRLHHLTLFLYHQQRLRNLVNHFPVHHLPFLRKDQAPQDLATELVRVEQVNRGLVRHCQRHG